MWTSLFVVLKCFLDEESWSREDPVMVGSNSTQANKSRAPAAVPGRLDLQALVKDFNTKMPTTYLNSIVKFSVNKKWLC
jgi:hypothetical protein